MLSYATAFRDEPIDGLTDHGFCHDLCANDSNNSIECWHIHFVSFQMDGERGRDVQVFAFRQCIAKVVQ